MEKCTRRQMLALSATALASACSVDNFPNDTAFSEPSDDGGPVRPNIIIYIADALRADALGAYNPNARWTPFLDKFARGSVVFEKCFSQATWTKPSMASLFTGVLPEVHQAVL